MAIERLGLRIIDNSRRVFDRLAWIPYSLLKWVGLVRPIQRAISKIIAPAITINNPLPLNYSSADEKIINHWRTYDTAELKIFSFSNVNISNKGIVFKGLSVDDVALPHPVFKFTFGLRYLTGIFINSKKQIVKDDVPCVLIFDHWSIVNYYHWVIDTLPRLYIMKEDMANYKLILPYDTPLYARQSLEAFKFKEIIEIKKNHYLHVKNLLIPHYTVGPGWHNKIVLPELRKTLLTSCKALEPTTEKVYVSRAKQQRRKVRNEEEVIQLVKEYGFSVIYFEGMSFWEQIAVMRNVKYYISSHGANVTNIFFMPEQARVLELNRDNKTNFCYYSLANSINLSYFYQLCQNIGHDDIIVNINLLRKNIELLLSKEVIPIGNANS